jgi:hypothetical protein
MALPPIVAGQALQRRWLTAKLHRLQASYLNHPIEIVPLRSKLQRAIGRPGVAQILLRPGYPESDVPAAPTTARGNRGHRMRRRLAGFEGADQRCGGISASDSNSLPGQRPA